MALRVLVTGATGSIGGAILELLIKKGHEVTALVRDEEKGRRLVANNGSLCKFVVLNLTSSSGPALQQLATGFDCVIQASQTSAEVEKVVYSAFLSAGLATAAQGGQSHFIYVSGCLVYGDCGDSTVDETHSTDNCVEMAKGRLDFEREILAAARERFWTTVLRPGWVYPGSYVRDYVQKTRALGRILVAESNPYLCVIHAEDLADLTVRILEHRSGGIFNVAEVAPLRAHDFAAVLSTALNLPIEYVSNPERYIQDVGFFMVGMTVSQKITSRGLGELAWKPRSLMEQLPDIVN